MAYKLYVLPTTDTVNRLHSMFLDVPVVIDYATLCVEIGSSEQKIVTDESVVYRALPGNLGIWYDSVQGRSSVILPLIPSPEMCARYEQVGDLWNRQFVPYMKVTDKFNNTSKVKPKLNSIATGLVDTLPVLEFFCETLVEGVYEQPSNADFYEDFLKSGLHRRQTFLNRTN